MPIIEKKWDFNSLGAKEGWKKLQKKGSEKFLKKICFKHMFLYPFFKGFSKIEF